MRDGNNTELASFGYAASNQRLWQQTGTGSAAQRTYYSVAGAGERVEYHHRDRLGTRIITNNQNTDYVK